MKFRDLLDTLPPNLRERMLGRMEGMQLAQRIAANRAQDMRDTKMRMEGGGESETVAAAIRMVQVQIGSGRMDFDLTEDELDAIWRMY